MDVVYPLGVGSRWEDTELRYSLRSLEKHVIGIGNVFVIGQKPIGYNNFLKHIPFGDLYNMEQKDRNIFEKIRFACQESTISEKFLFHNDDHFWVSNHKISEIPYWYDGSILRKILDRGHNDYQKKILTSTLQALNLRNLPTKNFDVHTPILYEKKKFLHNLKHRIYPWEIGRGYVIKSLYCNSLCIEGEPLKQNKILGYLEPDELRMFTQDLPCFSIGDHAITPMLEEYLMELYPNKSKWEL